MPGARDRDATRRDLLSHGAALLSAGTVLGTAALPAEAKDYTSRHEALDELDRLGAVCGQRLGTVRRSRPKADVLVSRFLAALQRHRTTRDDVRRRFGLPKAVDPGSQLGKVDDDLGGLRQSLDDLMVAHAECLPVFGDSKVVSRLAVDMVEVSRLRTVIDLWAESEAA